MEKEFFLDFIYFFLLYTVITFTKML